MKLKLNGIFGSDGIALQDLRKEASLIPEFLRSFKEKNQGFVKLPKVPGPILESKELAAKLKGKYKNIVILGIGGSALGITCIRDALMGPYWNLRGEPRLFVLDNLDLVQEFELCASSEESLFIVISKSGQTPETLAQYFYFRQKVAASQFVFISDPHEGELRRISKTEGIPCLDIPANVGGRFSVLSPVGLFPAALMSLDVDAMLEGAEEMLHAFNSESFEENLPFQIAAIQWLFESKYGVSINVMMPYSSFLLSFADWYRQLLAESIGKSGYGLTPVQALGVTDQHSQIQLYNEGPKDKLLIFLEIGKMAAPVIPNIEAQTLSYLSNISFHDLMRTEKNATEMALENYGRPNFTLEINELSAKNLGKLFMLFQCSVAFLGEYYKINAFDQPGVELGKKLTKQLLSSKLQS